MIPFPTDESSQSIVLVPGSNSFTYLISHITNQQTIKPLVAFKQQPTVFTMNFSLTSKVNQDPISKDEKKEMKKQEKERRLQEQKEKKEKKKREQLAKKEQKEREKQSKEKKQPTDKKQPKEKKQKAPADPNAPKKNIFGMEKKKPRKEIEAEIEELKSMLESKDQQLMAKNQEIMTKNQKLNHLQNWARSAPVY